MFSIGTPFGGGDTNLYGYVLSDPVNLIDLSGLVFESQARGGGPISPQVAGTGVPRLSNGGTFYVSPNGQTVQAPPGSRVGPTSNGAGLRITPPNSRGGANQMRLMDPTPQYPRGYGRIQDGGGRYLDRFGNPVSKDDPAGHICPGG